MRLPDFTQNIDWNRTRQQMNAPFRTWQASDDWKRAINLDEILSEEGLDVDSSDIVVAPNGTLEYAGHNVAVYIRDQPIHAQSPYRFHVANCRTLKQMSADGRYEKYVVATRGDGIFLVNETAHGKVIHDSVETRLEVCKNCLVSLRWQDYHYGMEHVWRNFNLREFFADYSSTITQRPRHTDQTSPRNEYPKNWENIATNYKKSIKWICEECSIDLSDRDGNRFLHVHHIDGRKENTQIRNLRGLCLECHRNQGSHQHMAKHRDYNAFQAYRRGRA